jgi:alpha-galactosidase
MSKTAASTAHPRYQAMDAQTSQTRGATTMWMPVTGMGARIARATTAAMALALVVTLAGCGTESAAPPRDTSYNGLARTPPMGWSSWNHFGCSITEADVEATVRALDRDGLRSAGYRYINVDDCWQASKRDSTGHLAADPSRFPDGIKALASYVHAHGFLFGIYATPGRRTCAEIYNNYPGRLGSLGHESADAQTFASWGVDYLKYDWCKADADGVERESAFTRMGAALKNTGRPIVFSIHDVPERPVPAWRRGTANLWRTTRDIHDNWGSLTAIVRANVPLAAAAVIGGWNDSDMLEVGNGGMSQAEYRTHFSLWAEMAAPLILGNDVSSQTEATTKIVENQAVIAVDQDRRGIQGTAVVSTARRLVLIKPLSDDAFAVTLTNLSSESQQIQVSAHELGLPASPQYTIVNLWTGARTIGSGRFSAHLASHDTVVLRVVSRGR